jgi:anaphase-promoting complex subunit 11
MKVKIKKWKGVATWLWDIEEVKCTICQSDFESPCPKCKTPGDDCVPVQGSCNHHFHLHCIMRWVDGGKEDCPNCRMKWEPKS